MWNVPTAKQLEKIPALYSTENVPCQDKVIHMHFFIGGCDWYIAERSALDGLLWGFCILNGDLQNAEWVYVSLDELLRLRAGFMEVDRDLHWKVRKAVEVDQISKAQGWALVTK